MDTKTVGSDIFEHFKNIPKEGTNEFEILLSNIAKNYDLDFIALGQEMNRLLEIGDNSTAYAIFFVLVTKHRYNNNYNHIENLDKLYRDRFKLNSTYNHIILIYKLERGVFDNEFKLIKEAYENAELLNKENINIGAAHLFSDFIATVCEIADDNIKDEIISKWLEKALEYVEIAIDNKPDYAKFYCTRGRLYSLKGQHKKAYGDICKAIEMEDSKRKDYAIKMSEYKRYKNQVILNKRIQEMTEMVSQCSEKLDGAVTGNLEFLGLFAGVISFVIGSIQIASGQNFRDAASLIVVLMGALISAFSIFGIIISKVSKKKMLINITAFLMGIVIVLGGLFIV